MRVGIELEPHLHARQGKWSREIYLIYLKAIERLASYSLVMTLGEAFHIAVELRERFRGDAVNVAADWADTCNDNGDTAGFDAWNRVCAMITHLDRDSVRLPN